MRYVHVAFVGSVIAALTVPVLAKSSTAQKAEDKAAASICSAYQQAPDGSWMQLPCQESGESGASGAHGQAHTEHRPATQGTDREPR